MRYLTRDVVEWDSDDWKFYPESTYTTGILEILGSNKNCIEMILEMFYIHFPTRCYVSIILNLELYHVEQGFYLFCIPRKAINSRLVACNSFFFL